VSAVISSEERERRLAGAPLLAGVDVLHPPT
jgi:hypothetical protein